MRGITQNRKGFSLVEILVAMGVLAIGMVFMASVFSVGVLLMARSSEETIAAVVADEAFAKIRLLAADPNIFEAGFSRTLDDATGGLPEDVYAYPSTDITLPKQYYWSAIGRRVDGNNVQVTVFVCRKVGSGPKYWFYSEPPATSTTDGLIPSAYPVNVTNVIDDQRDPATGSGPVIVKLASGVENLINDGYTVVDGLTGQIRPVLHRDGLQLTVYAHEAVAELMGQTRFWVVPPPVAGGRYPCIGVYQKVVTFRKSWDFDPLHIYDYVLSEKHHSPHE